jgi:hypothetical protein
MVRTVGVAILAVGLAAQAAQAKPLEVLPRHAVIQATRHVQAWSPARMHAVGNPAARGRAWVIRAQRPAAVAPGSGGMDWMAVAVGAAIAVLVGALGAALFRLRPQRPSAA